MTQLIINDLESSLELDREALEGLAGGRRRHGGYRGRRHYGNYKYYYKHYHKEYYNYSYHYPKHYYFPKYYGGYGC